MRPRRIVRWLVDLPPEVWVTVAAAALVFSFGVVSALLDWCWYPVC